MPGHMLFQPSSSAAAPRQMMADGCSASAIVSAAFDRVEQTDVRKLQLSASEALLVCDSGTQLAVAAELHNRVCEALSSPSRHWAQQCVLPLVAEFMPYVPQDVVVRGRVLQLSMDPEGCRLVQAALDEGDSSVRAAIARELRGHVCEAVESPHANHVLQRLVELLRPADVCFVLEECRGKWGPLSPSVMARHRFGCRVLERIIEHFSACPRAVRELACFLDAILQDAASLCFHSFGTFVVQHILEYGSVEQQRRIVAQLLRGDLSKVALDMHAAGVLDKALSFPPAEDQRALAQAILLNEGLLLQMAGTRKGLPAAERLMRIVDGAALEEACRQICSDRSKYMKSKGGRWLAQLAETQTRSPRTSPATPVSSVAVHTPPTSPQLEPSATPSAFCGPLDHMPPLDLEDGFGSLAQRPRSLSGTAAVFVPTGLPFGPGGVLYLMPSDATCQPQLCW